MGVETTPIAGIWALNENWPEGSDSRREGDDHSRIIKEAVKNTFPQIDNVVNASDEELNFTVGLTAGAQTQLDALGTGKSDVGHIHTLSDVTDSGALAAKDKVAVSDLANGVDGQLITWSATGAPTVVATGSAGQVLTSNGAGNAPNMQPIPNQTSVIASGLTTDTSTEYNSQTGWAELATTGTVTVSSGQTLQVEIRGLFSRGSTPGNLFVPDMRILHNGVVLDTVTDGRKLNDVDPGGLSVVFSQSTVVRSGALTIEGNGVAGGRLFGKQMQIKWSVIR